MSDEIDITKGDATRGEGAAPHDGGPDGTLSRQQSWPVGAAAEVEIAIDLGRVTVHLDDAPSDTSEVHVEIRHDPEAGGGWAQGMSGFMQWIGSASESWTGAGFGSVVEGPEQFAARAVKAAEISWSGSGGRLVVRSSPEMPLRLVPLAVTVRAPAGSRLAARTGAGDVDVTGRAGWAALRTGSGRITAADVDGDVDLTTGSGDVSIGDVAGRARIKTGSGDISVNAVAGPTTIKAGSGEVALGRVAADLGARTGSGRVRISDAVSGRFDLTTGSGDLLLAVHQGVVAELDLSSGSGTTRSDLDVGSGTPPQPAALRVQGRTGTGDVLVTRATVLA